MNVPIREAADVLNVSVDTVRRRIRTGALRAERDDQGRWIVVLGDEQLPFRVARYGNGADQDYVTRQLTDMCDFLRAQLDGRAREVEQLTSVVRALTEQREAVLNEVVATLTENRKLLERALRGK